MLFSDLGQNRIRLLFLFKFTRTGSKILEFCFRDLNTLEHVCRTLGGVSQTETVFELV